MKIAAVVVTYNDDYKFEEWVSHHEVYKNGIDKHIIVDNGSQVGYVDKLEKSFTKSHIIKRKTNGGSTGAYNDGIRFALEDPDVDAILLIGNDIRMESDGVRKLAHYLFSNPKLGMVAPVLLGKDSEVIDDYGCEISNILAMKPYGVGILVSDVKISERIVTAVTGGMNMATREFYEIVGLQDENLFMYSDEIDMATRARKAGFYMGVSKNIKSWHQHINPPENGTLRHPFSSYLIGRNKVYIARKHYGITKEFIVFGSYFIKGITSFLKSIISNDKYLRKSGLWLVIGTMHGLAGIMRKNRFSHPHE